MLEGGIVIDDDGEIIESGDNDALAVIATRRAYAKTQQKQWEAIVADYDRVLLRKQDNARATYGDVVISVRSGTYSDTDTTAFADDVAELPLEFGDLITIIAAARGFHRDDLPDSVLAAFDANTETLTKRPWVESRVAARQAPVFEHAPGWEGDDGTV